MVQEHNKEIFIWKTRVFQFHLCQEKTGTEKVWFGHAFWCRVTNFKPHLLSPQKSKLKNFSAHQQEDFLRISKLTLLLFLVPILKELWQFETSGHFFWDTLYMYTTAINTSSLVILLRVSFVGVPQILRTFVIWSISKHVRGKSQQQISIFSLLTIVSREKWSAG